MILHWMGLECSPSLESIRKEIIHTSLCAISARALAAEVWGSAITDQHPSDTYRF